MMDTAHTFAQMYSSPIPHDDNNLDINSSMTDSSSWNHSHQSPSRSSSTSGQLFPTVPNSSEQVDFTSTSGTSAFIHHHQSDVYGVQQQSSSGSSSLALDQIESSVGPSRVLTRRQRAAALNHQGVRRVTAPAYGTSRDSNDSSQVFDDYPSVPIAGCLTQQQHPQRHHTGYLLPRSASRSATPTSTTMSSDQYTQQPQRVSLNMNTVPLQFQYPSTPLSATSAYSPYNIYPSNHSRSNSTSNANPRTSSPALSSGSGLTSLNSLSFPGFTHPSTATISPLAPREKMKKQRLYNVDRKAICEFHRENPNARQEDIARRYKVERSTISKILKHKTKWLNVPAEEQMRVAKHRPSKFPEVEEQLVKWLIEARKTNTVLTDALIRANAKEAARKLHISDEKFKASSGWVENFKHRHGIRGGVWHGDGKNARLARSMGTGGLEESASRGHDLSFDSGEERPIVSVQNFPGDMDDGYESGRSPDSEMHNGDSESSSVTLQPAWRTAADHATNGDLSPTHSYHSGSPTMQESPIVFHQHDPPIPHHDSQSDQQADLQTHTSPSSYAPALVMYPLPAPEDPPTLADAEVALNKVILFVDTTGHGILTDEERQNLHQIKTVLFQAGSGVPYR